MDECLMMTAGTDVLDFGMGDVAPIEVFGEGLAGLRLSLACISRSGTREGVCLLKR